MQLIKNRTLIIYLLVFIFLFALYVIVIVSNQEIILNKFHDIFKKRYSPYSKAFLFFTFMPFLFISVVIVSLLTDYYGKITNYLFKDDVIEIKTRKLNSILKKGVTKLFISEENNQVVKIVFVTKNNRYSVYRVDEDFFNATVDYFQLEKVDKIKQEFNSKLITKTYKLV